MKIDWKRKLSSRKFWMAVTGFLSMMILYLGGSNETALKMTELVMAGATLLCYIIGEGISDSGYGATDSYTCLTTQTEEIKTTQESEEEEHEGHQATTPDPATKA
jgi:hypothetical protein